MFKFCIVKSLLDHRPEGDATLISFKDEVSGRIWHSNNPRKELQLLEMFEAVSHFKCLFYKCRLGYFVQRTADVRETLNQMAIVVA